MRAKKEYHRYHNQGVTYTPELQGMYRNKIIDELELVLLMTINSLCKRHRKTGILRGCWASNAYLGKEIHRSARRTRFIISRLKEIGLLKEAPKRKQIGNNSYRVLFPTWVPRKIPLSGSKGINKSKYLNNGGVAEFGHGGVAEFGHHMNTKTVRRNALSDPSLRAVSAECVPVNSTVKKPTKKQGNNTTVKPARVDSSLDIDKNWTIKLHRSVVLANKLSGRPSLEKWKKSFRLLREDGVDKDRIDKVLDWYVKNIGGDFVPEVYCAEIFRKKFIRVENAMKKQNSFGSSKDKSGVTTLRQKWIKSSIQKIPVKGKSGVFVNGWVDEEITRIIKGRYVDGQFDASYDSLEEDPDYGDPNFEFSQAEDD